VRTHTLFSLFAASALLAAALSMGVGLSLAHWSDEVRLTGSASMGTLVWDLTPTALAWNTNTVMEFDTDIDDPGDGPGATGLVAVDLDNAYPNGYGAILLVVRNEGTIPVHVVFWVEPSASCASTLMDYVMLNPAFDAPFYNGLFDYDDYSTADISSGWLDAWTHSVSWWTANHGTPAEALSLEDIAASGHILKLPTGSTTTMEYDDDSIIMPGEKSAIFIWLGLSDELQEHEELMGVDCRPAFYIHYLAVQASP
jgi:hypothetical protein